MTGGRTWSLPSTATPFIPPSSLDGQGGVDAGGQGAPLSPTSAPAPAVTIAAPDTSGFADLAQETATAGQAAAGLAEEMDKAAEASAKISTTAPKELADGMKEAASSTDGLSLKMTGLDSLTDELGELGEKAKNVFGETSDGKQAADLEATAAAAEKGGEAVEKTASSFAENAKKVSDSIKARQDAAMAAGEAEKGGQEKLSSAYSEHVKKVIEELNKKREAETGASEEEVKETEETVGAQEDGVEAYSENVQKVLDSIKAKSKAAKEGGEVEGEAAKKTGDMGEATLAAAQAADDLQYGFKGILNNLPVLAEKLGLGAGIAGVIGLVSVAVFQLLENFDVFGTKAQEAAKKAAEAFRALSTESRNAANEAKDAADDAAEADEIWDRHAQAIDGAALKYKNLKQDIDNAATARQRLDRLTLEASDAETALALAEVESGRTKGDITDTEAEIQSAKIKEAARKKRFDIEQAELANKANDLLTDAANKEQDLLAKSQKNTANKAAIPNLLSDNERTFLEEEIKGLEIRINEAKQDIKKTPSKIKDLPPGKRAEAIEDYIGRNPQKEPGLFSVQRREDAPDEQPNPDLVRLAKARDENIKKYEELRKKLEVDSLAQLNPDKITDGPELKRQVRKYDAEEPGIIDEIAKQREDAYNLLRDKKERSKVFPVLEKVENITSGDRITEIQRKKNEEAEKEREALEKESNQLTKKDQSKVIDRVMSRWNETKTAKKLSSDDDDDDEDYVPVKAKKGKKGKKGKYASVAKSDEKSQKEEETESLSNYTATLTAMKDGIQGKEWDNYIQAAKDAVAALGGRNAEMIAVMRGIHADLESNKKTLLKERE
ncbi:MAG: hypothetical protein V4726_07365 [Verrucomicrobiota bacterium]